MLALTWGQRLYGLTAQSLWYDEGTSVNLAMRPLAEILTAAAADIHPPLYYILLRGWGLVAGTGEFAVRSLSVFAAVVTVALVMHLARRVAGDAAGIVAGALAALSPYLWWYGQEVRSYGLVALLATALTVAAVDWRRLRAAVAGALLAGCLAHTHYLGAAFALAGASGFVSADAFFSAGRAARKTGRRPVGLPRSAVAWLLGQVAAIALFVPWLVRAWPAMRAWPAVGPAMTPLDLAAASLEHVAYQGGGPAYAAAGTRGLLAAAAMAAIAVLAVAALVAPLRAARVAPSPRLPAILAVLMSALAAPAGLMAMTAFRPAWNAKFLAGSVPAWEALAAAGLVQLALTRRRWRALAVAGAVAALVAVPRMVVVRATVGDAGLQRDDYRGLVAAIAAESGPKDAVVLNAPTQIEIFDYYAKGRLDAYPLPIGRPPDVAATDAALTAILADHRHVTGVFWATQESDPEGRVAARLAADRFLAFDRWRGHLRQTLWLLPTTPLTAAPAPLPIHFGDAVRLVAADWSGATASPGTAVYLRLTWATEPNAGSGLIAFTQLIDSGGRLAVGRDLPPAGGRLNQADATGGVDNQGLMVPRDAPPGDYELILGLYRAADGGRLPVRTRDNASSAAGPTPRDYVSLGRVVLTAAPEG